MLISKKGCEVASSLLALDLLEDGHAPAVITGYFALGGKRTPHTWVEVKGRILDPTHEQFSVHPEAEADAGCYGERTIRMTERAAIEAWLNEKLMLQTWNEERRRLVEHVARRHALTIDTDALLAAYTPRMERLANEMNSGKPSVTPIAELPTPGEGAATK